MVVIQPRVGNSEWAWHLLNSSDVVSLALIQRWAWVLPGLTLSCLLLTLCKQALGQEEIKATRYSSGLPFPMSAASYRNECFNHRRSARPLGSGQTSDFIVSLYNKISTKWLAEQVRWSLIFCNWVGMKAFSLSWQNVAENFDKIRSSVTSVFCRNSQL